MSDLGQIVKTYNYTDENGNLVFQVCRYEPKTFRQRRPDGNGGWIWSLDGTRRVLYRLPELIKAPMQDFVFIVEGEKDADNLIARNFIATTCPGGAGKWMPEYNQYFRGRLVAIPPHNDEPGRKHAQQVAEALYRIAAEIKIVELPGLLDKGGDISDWFESSGPEKIKELISLIENTEIFKPTKSNFPLTDAGNAERFAAMNGDKLRYCPEDNHWHFYDGCRWNAELGEEKAGQLAIGTVRAIARDADDESLITKSEREKILQFSLSSESANRIRAMLSLSKNLTSIVCHAKEFDRDGFLFNCANGTIDLKTGNLREHNANDMLTKLSPVEYDMGAELELWDKFLDDSTGGDIETKEFLQRAIGYTLTGDTKEEKLFFVHGPTAAGKSTFLEAIKSALGDYALTTDFETFVKRGQVGGIRNDVARLAGTRFVVSIEVDEGKELAEGLVKLMTGGDTVSARFLYRESFEFVPACKLWLAANHAPRASDRDDALWRRILRIPFEHTVPENKRDTQVKAVLRNPKTAGPAILAWAVKGCLQWQQKGLAIPVSIRDATEQYREEQDPLRDFFDNECEFDNDCYIPVTALRQRYDVWAKENGLKFTLGPKQFNERLKDKGCEQRIRETESEVGTLKPTRCWLGVTLQANPKRSEQKETTVCQEKIPF
ncbi:MAG: phage/plasmid primase, P4 family [Sedimentisphaerales bacterium]